MAKLKASNYRGPNSRKANRAKRLEKQKRNQTRAENKLKRTELRNDMKKFNKNYKLQRDALRNERLKINKKADNIRAVGAAVSQNVIPSTVAFTTSEATSHASDNAVKKHQIDQLINSGVTQASTENEEEASNTDFQWR